MDAETKIIKARVQLLLEHPFFGQLAFHLQPKIVDWLNPPTAATDGRYIYFHKDFVEKCTVEELMGTYCHEILHIALEHFDRRGHRKPGKWNAAADYATNWIIKQAGLQLPEGCLYDPKFANMNAEKIYELLPDMPDGEGWPDYPFDYHPETTSKGKDKEGDKPGKIEIPKEVLEEWKHKIAQAAAQARMRGNMVAYLEEIIKEIFKPKVNWREVLRRFVIQNFKSDYRWVPPNKKFVSHGLYLPSISGEGLGTIAVAVDVSGSVSTKEIQQFLGEVQGILDTYDCELWLIQHDREVKEDVVQVYRKGDVLDEVKIVGRGGTSHIPVFEYINRNIHRPTCVVCCTDGYTEVPDTPPDYPVLWVLSTRHTDVVKKFGEIVFLDVE
jgi:predicted metal-dependent peptidase